MSKAKETANPNGANVSSTNHTISFSVGAGIIAFYFYRDWGSMKTVQKVTHGGQLKLPEVLIGANKVIDIDLPVHMNKLSLEPSAGINNSTNESIEFKYNNEKLILAPSMHHINGNNEMVNFTDFHSLNYNSQDRFQGSSCVEFFNDPNKIHVQYKAYYFGSNDNRVVGENTIFTPDME